jgi:hypothetical protein
MVFYDIINKWINTNTTNLDTRMRSYLYTHNSKRCHGFKPFIITLKSKSILDYLNHLTNYDDKVKQLELVQQVFFNVSKSIYTKFDPNLVYTFENEINIVFFYNDSGIFLFDGNVNRLISTLASYTSIQVYKELLRSGVDLESSFSGQFIEFDIDYEVLNYLVWRQMDCRRNTITLLYKCVNIDDVLDGKNVVEKIKIDDMISYINERVDKNKITNIEHLLTGNIIKKYIFYKTRNNNNDNHNKINNEIVARKSVGVEHFFFSDNFKSNLQKYVINKIY